MSNKWVELHTICSIEPLSFSPGFDEGFLNIVDVLVCELLYCLVRTTQPLSELSSHHIVIVSLEKSDFIIKRTSGRCINSHERIVSFVSSFPNRNPSHELDCGVKESFNVFSGGSVLEESSHSSLNDNELIISPHKDNIKIKKPF